MDPMNPTLGKGNQKKLKVGQSWLFFFLNRRQSPGKIQALSPVYFHFEEDKTLRGALINSPSMLRATALVTFTWTN